MLEQGMEDRLLREDLYQLENKLDSIEAKLACPADATRPDACRALGAGYRRHHCSFRDRSICAVAGDEFLDAPAAQ